MRIVIIKLFALGDVVRTIPLASAIKKKFPESEITWVTRSEAQDLLRGQRCIEKIRALPFETTEEFDILYNFDIDDDATSLALKINAKQKFGFYSDGGYPAAFNLGSEYYLNTLFDDELKKSNKKTYQEMMFEAAELPYEKIKYKINLSDQEIQKGKEFLSKNNLGAKKIIGINVGASPRWPSKAWDEEKLLEFIKKVKGSDRDVILLGGSSESEKLRKLKEKLKEGGIDVCQNNPQNTLMEFASVLQICDTIVCSDTLALHLSIGLGKKTIGLFFCTTPHEVETYNLLKKITAKLFENYFPEKSDQYMPALTQSISVEEVFSKLEEIENE